MPRATSSSRALRSSYGAPPLHADQVAACAPHDGRSPCGRNQAWYSFMVLDRGFGLDAEQEAAEQPKR